MRMIDPLAQIWSDGENVLCFGWEDGFGVLVAF